MRLLIEGEEWEKARMVSAILALYDKETINIEGIEYHPKIVVEGFKENGSPNTETIEDIISVTFSFIIFEQMGESNPYLEKLREQGEKIVARILMKDGEKKTVIIRPTSNNKQLD